MTKEAQDALAEIAAALENIDALIDVFEQSIATLKAARARGVDVQTKMLAEAFAEMDGAGNFPPPLSAN